MSRIALFRSRQIWMPTIFGLFFLLFIGLVISLLVVRNIYPFLAQNEPVGASILVVEGWLAPKELDQAILTFKEGNYENLLTTGGPIIGWPEFYLAFGGILKHKSVYPDKSLLKVQMFISEGK